MTPTHTYTPQFWENFTVHFATHTPTPRVIIVFWLPAEEEGEHHVMRTMDEKAYGYGEEKYLIFQPLRSQRRARRNQRAGANDYRRRASVTTPFLWRWRRA